MLEKEISDRRVRYRRDVAKLVQLVVDAEDAGAKAAQGRATATELLQRDARAMREKLEETGRASIALVDVAAKGAPDEAQKARSELSRKLSTSSRLIKYLDTNIDQQQMLGLDVKADIEYLVSHLQLRADMTAGVLQSTKEEIDEIATRAGADTDAESQKQLASLKKQRDALAESQRVNVQLMDEYGLETVRLRQGIIVATGKLSQDIFDKDVASGLVESWFARCCRLVSEQRGVTGLSGSGVRFGSVRVLHRGAGRTRAHAARHRPLEPRRIELGQGLLHQDDRTTDPALRIHHRDCAARRRSRATCSPASASLASSSASPCKTRSRTLPPE